MPNLLLNYHHNEVKVTLELHLKFHKLTLAAEMFGVGDFWLEIRVIIKILSHPWYPRTIGRFSNKWSKKFWKKKISCFFASFVWISIRQRFLDIKDGTKFWWSPWFPAKNHPPQTFQPQVYETKIEFQMSKLD